MKTSQFKLRNQSTSLMNPVFTFFNSIVLLGAVQGFIISGLLFYSKKASLSNKILSALIFLLSLASLKIYLNNQDWFNSGSAFHLIETFVPFFVIMPVGPLILFYVKSITDPDFSITKQQRRHFLPVIIDFVPHLTAILYTAGLLTHIFKKSPAWESFIDSYYVYSDIPRWISVSTYLWFSTRVLSAYKDNNTAIVKNGYYKWLRSVIAMFTVFQAAWLLHLVPYVIPKYSDKLLATVDWFPIYIPLTILIYWLGIRGYIIAYNLQPAINTKKNASTLPMLSPSDVEEAVGLLKKSMEEQKLFLDPTLSLGSLANHTGLPQKMLSSVLNQHLHKSFNEFVNGYRVEALKEKMQLPEMSNLTIAGVAFECGFNSQATFQRSFKDITGMSPSEFRKNALRTS